MLLSGIALDYRAIVAVVVGLFIARGAAQVGIGGVFAVLGELVFHDQREPLLGLLEVRGIDHVLLARRQNGADLALRSRDAVGRLRMVAVKLHGKARALFLQGLKLFEKTGHAVGIVSGLVRVLHAQI